MFRVSVLRGIGRWRGRGKEGTGEAVLNLSGVVRKEVIEDCVLYQGDCSVILPQLQDFDLILTDPPYGININKSPRLSTSRGFSGENWDCSPIPEWMISLLLAKSNEQIVWGGNYYRLPPGRCFLIWDKNNSGRDFADCEFAWTSLDSVARLFAMRLMNMDGGKVHPTQKPISLMEWCLSHAPDALTVCDPFMGSGTTGVACARK
jgi:DNA modification methylase